MTQAERVLAAAKRFNGVCQTDMLLPDVCDGGPPITRLAARLYELEQQGHSFECLGRRNQCKVWRLVEVDGGDSTVPDESTGSEVPPPPAVTAVSPGQLFEIGQPEMSVYEYELHGEAA